jgi:quinolinate synthase
MAITGDDGYITRIAALKHERRAVVVAHNYTLPEIQDVADFTGDSLELARRCVEIDADTIVFCGVRFMAETAAILNPERTVLLAEGSAGCPLADFIDAAELKIWQRRYPGVPVVTYINSSAEIKAESYICCTSANGVKVAASVPGDDILFVPDQNLGHFIAGQTDKNVILYPGYCHVHHQLTPEQVKEARERYPEAAVIVHPECRSEVIDLADAALSTSQMLRYVTDSPNRSFIVGTEAGLLHQLRRRHPDRAFHLLTDSLICPDMKKTTLTVLADTLEHGRNRVTVPEEIRVRAKKAIDRMLAIA